MLVKGVFTSISGSLGGITGSHNRGGQYIRARTIPTDPGTAFQQAMRNHMANLSNQWLNTLAQAERDGWDLYADNVEVLNPLGDAIKLSGMNHFIRSNAPLLQAGESVIDTAPTTFNLGEFTAVSMTASDSTQQISLTFDDDDAWAKVAGGFMFVWISRPQNATINFFKGPYRYAGKVVGDTTPPTSPAAIAVPFTIAEDQKLFARVAVQQGDGRYSASQFLECAVGA